MQLPPRPAKSKNPPFHYCHIMGGSFPDAARQLKSSYSEYGGMVYSSTIVSETYSTLQCVLVC